MARGYPGAFGRAVTEPQIWIPLLALFLIPLLRWRRLLSWHTLDLLALCGFSVSLVWFNRGEIFTSVPLAYPPMALPGRAPGLDRSPRLAAGEHGRDRGHRCRPGLTPPASGLLVSDVAPRHRHARRRRPSARAQRVRQQRHRRGVRRRDRRRPHRARADPVRHVPVRLRAMRHIRPGDVPDLRPVRAGNAVERQMERPARGPRRSRVVRPGCAARHDRAGMATRGPTPGGRAGRWRGRRFRSRPTRSRATRTTRWSRRASCGASFWRTDRSPGASRSAWRS